MANAFGIDVSRYQGKMDWDIVSLHEPDVVFAGIRATVSWGYRDSWFTRNWTESKRVGILRMAYHVVYPGESASRQVDNFVGALSGDYGELPPVLDLELDHGYGAAAITKNVLSIAQLVESRIGKRPILYSRAGWVNQFLAGAAWLNEYDWWLAHYLTSGAEHPGPPALPRGVTRWLIHQTTSHGKGIGSESLNMDYNRWNGTEQDVYEYAGISQPPPDEEHPYPSYEWAVAIDAWARSQGYNGVRPDEGLEE